MLLAPRSLLVALLACSAVVPVPAQAPVLPDCRGISDVSDFDGAAQSDFVDLLTTVRVATGLDSPVHVVSPPDGPAGPDDRLFIVEQPGTIRILDLTTGTLLPDPFLDIQSSVQTIGNEEGLLSLAFHPDYNSPAAANEGRIFVYYTNDSGNNQVSRFGLTNDPNVADESSEEVVIEIGHPSWTNHNGGQLAFGPDGRLYLAPGDGGGSCDPFGAAQDLDDLRGKMLRLDVDALPYQTTGNPFDGSTPGLDEIWASGLRNPWRFSFDRGTGALYVADVGQNVWEEISCRPASSTGGENYGWSLYEGAECPNPSCGGTPPACSSITHTAPIVQYDHSRDGFSCSITGGYVYRGCRMSDLHGSYFYADFCSDQIRSFRTGPTCTASAETPRTADLDPPGGLDIDRISSFGEDSRGEIYICDRDGDVYKVLPEFAIMQVSGAGATPLSIGAAGFAWEDLETASAHPVSEYKVYRAAADPTGPFECLHRGAGTTWAGDPQAPLPGQAFYYLVTALNSAGGETRPGNRSDGMPRTVDTLSICP